MSPTRLVTGSDERRLYNGCERLGLELLIDELWTSWRLLR